MTSFCQEISNSIDYFKDHENVSLGLRGLVETAKTLHPEERSISLLSVRIVGLLVEQNAPVNFWMSQEKFARYIGLTPDQFYKRAQAARVFRKYPKLVDAVECGDACVRHIAMIAGKITHANNDILMEGIKGKSTGEVRDLLA